MTGRGMGFCAGYDTPGYMNPGINPRAGRNAGFGFGFGRGQGRGNRWGFYATGQPGWARGTAAPYPGSMAASQPDEIQYLKNRAEMLKRELSEINARIDQLNAAGADRENR
jgi:hypothetical protein